MPSTEVHFSPVRASLPTPLHSTGPNAHSLHRTGAKLKWPTTTGPQLLTHCLSALLPCHSHSWLSSGVTLDRVERAPSLPISPSTRPMQRLREKPSNARRTTHTKQLPQVFLPNTQRQASRCLAEPQPAMVVVLISQEELQWLNLTEEKECGVNIIYGANYFCTLKAEVKIKRQTSWVFLSAYFTLPSPLELSTFFPIEFSHHKVTRKL